MKIGIDARQISHKKRHGLRTYTENLVKALSRIDTENEYVLYLDAKDPFSLDHLGDNFTATVLPWHVKYLSTLLNDHVLLPLRVERDKLDVMHYPSNPVNMYNTGKTVLTMHDAPPFFTGGKSFLGRRTRADLYNLYSSMLIAHAAKKALHIINVSEKSKDDLLRHTRLPSKGMTVIHEGVDESFREIENGDAIEHIQRKYNLGDKFILGFSHKNGERIIRAYEALSDAVKAEYKVGLICIKRTFSRDLRKIIHRNRLKKKIICIPPVSDEDLILMIIKNDALRKELKGRGLEQAARYSWEETALKTLKVYEEVYRSAKAL